MRGSDKQIRWAEQIQADALSRFDGLADQVQSSARPVFDAIRNEIAQTEDAAWLIDNRDLLQHPMQWMQAVIRDRGEQFGAPQALIDQVRQQAESNRQETREAGGQGSGAVHGANVAK